MKSSTKSTAKAERGFTLIELMIAMVIGLFISLMMMNYFVQSMRSTTVQRIEKGIAMNAQTALSILTQAVREAGSGNPASADVPFYSGRCGASWAQCTDNGSGRNPDRMAVLLKPSQDRDCTNTAIAPNAVVANVYFIESNAGRSSLSCRGFDVKTEKWIGDAEPLVDGIENLQISYRVQDSENATQRYLAADNVPAVQGSLELGWDFVRAVSLSLIASDASGDFTPGTEATQSFKIGDAPLISFTDQVLRRVFSTHAIIYSKMGQ